MTQPEIDLVYFEATAHYVSHSTKKITNIRNIWNYLNVCKLFLLDRLPHQGYGGLNPLVILLFQFSDSILVSYTKRSPHFLLLQ